MLNITKNSITRCTSDVTSINNGIWLFQNIVSRDWYVLLNKYAPGMSSNRWNVFQVVDGDFQPIETSELIIDVVNKQNLYFYKTILQGRFQVNLELGEYNVYYTDNQYDDIDDDFILFSKQCIEEINQLTESDDFRLYLKYNATLMSVK